MVSSSAGDRVRIDIWLWAARFFKTRAMATRAVNGGHVQVNGERVKPARPVFPGDLLRIRRGPVEFSVEVLGVSRRRGPFSVARELYRESEESIARREAEREERRILRAAAPLPPPSRPNKRQRRMIRDFVRGE